MAVQNHKSRDSKLRLYDSAEMKLYAKCIEHVLEQKQGWYSMRREKKIHALIFKSLSASFMVVGGTERGISLKWEHSGTTEHFVPVKAVGDGWPHPAGEEGPSSVQNVVLDTVLPLEGQPQGEQLIHEHAEREAVHLQRRNLG